LYETGIESAGSPARTRNAARATLSICAVWLFKEPPTMPRPIVESTQL
jgi:hypothetical protein